jgi:hypothetical protein
MFEVQLNAPPPAVRVILGTILDPLAGSNEPPPVRMTTPAVPLKPKPTSEPPELAAAAAGRGTLNAAGAVAWSAHAVRARTAISSLETYRGLIVLEVMRMGVDEPHDRQLLPSADRMHSALNSTRWHRLDAEL